MNDDMMGAYKVSSEAFMRYVFVRAIAYVAGTKIDIIARNVEFAFRRNAHTPVPMAIGCEAGCRENNEPRQTSEWTMSHSRYQLRGPTSGAPSGSAFGPIFLPPGVPAFRCGLREMFTAGSAPDRRKRPGPLRHASKRFQGPSESVCSHDPGGAPSKHRERFVGPRVEAPRRLPSLKPADEASPASVRG